MPSFTVKNIPEELYIVLKSTAEQHRRSVNNEIIICLERALGHHRVDTRSTVERARRLRSSFSGPPVTDGELRDAKEHGRP